MCLSWHFQFHEGTVPPQFPNHLSLLMLEEDLVFKSLTFMGIEPLWLINFTRGYPFNGWLLWSAAADPGHVRAGLEQQGDTLGAVVPCGHLR